MLRDKVIEIFVKVDDFCKEIQPLWEKNRKDATSFKPLKNIKIGLC